MKHSLVVLFFLSSLLLFAGEVIVSGQDTPLAKPQESQQEEDLVHFGDIIDVDVVGGFEFDWRGTLTPEGDLDGFSEPVYGLCRSEAQISSDIVKVYSKILRDPKIIVRIIDRSNRAVVRLDGGVKTPMRFRLKRPASLRELLVLAGGLTDEASGDISLFRQKNLSCRAGAQPTDTTQPLVQDNGSQVINIKISELLSGKAAANPQILSGDLITVTQAPPVYVIGAVNNPRPVYARFQTTVSHAIASAGGLAKDGLGAKVSIFRRDGRDTRTITVDLDKIKRGESEDEILKPFDIIDVAAKGGGKRKYPPVAASGENRKRVITVLPLRVVD